jgi:hypothetical protein
MKMLRNLVLAETVIVCVTAVLISFGYFNLRYCELRVQIELARAISQRPSLQIIPEWDEKDAAPPRQGKL